MKKCLLILLIAINTLTFSVQTLDDGGGVIVDETSSSRSSNSGPSSGGSNLREICPNILHQVFDQCAPKGYYNSGNFTEHTKAGSDLKICVEDCCRMKSDCNVAFVYNNNCYHVKCVSNEACLPKHREQVTGTLQMVLVNPVGGGGGDGDSSENPSWMDLLKTSNLYDFLPPDQDKLSPIFWKKPHKFRFPNSNTLQDTIPYMSEDDQTTEKRINPFLLSKNYERYGVEQQYAPDDDMDADETSFLPTNRNLITCEVGLDKMCGVNEECAEITEKSHGGVCKCLEGHKRNELGQCVKVSVAIGNIAGGGFSSSRALVQQILASEENPNGRNRDQNAVTQADKGSITKAPSKQLAVRVISKTVRLPEKEVSLVAYTVPDEQSSGDTYKYLWTLISQPKGAVNGTISDQSKNKVKLSNLSEGIYIFKVTVTGNASYGETVANVTVLPENRINKIPQVIITPKEQIIKNPNNKAILDGSTSIDDDKIVKWHWELIEGPIGYQPQLPETSTLQLTDLNSPGNYSFQLTVTDSNGAQNSTKASITVLKGTDYPPEANAGTDVIVYLPHNNVTLNGTLSTDDREIVAWEWTKDVTDQGKAVDMQNTRTPFLQLSNLEEGIYTFVLKVTDASNQSSTAKVHVFVKPPTNSPPIANAGTNSTINLPQTWVILNGTQSKDDIRIINYVWKQISGPNKAVILNGNTSIANATSLTIGNYKFELTVMDENKNNASDFVWIKVVQEKNSPPVANAGGDQSVTLPVSAIYLNGSKSYDDLGIVNYSWTRDGSSLATGNIVGQTDHEAVMILTNVFTGRYVFKLTVTDDQGLTSTDTVSVFVHRDPLMLNLVELTLSMGISVLSQSELESIVQKIVLLIGDVKLHIRELRLEPKSSDAIIVFYVEKIANDGRNQIIPGLEIEKILKDKFWRDASILGTPFTDVRTAVCQNKCSDHGVCNTVTRACMCETFWMPSVFYFWGVEDANCDWSILYVIVGVFLGFLLLSSIFWGISCIFRRSRKPRSRPKVQKYALLGTQDEEMPPFTRGTSLTDSETDSDVLFENRTKQNGILRSNGTTKNGPKYSTTRLGRRIKT